MLILQQPLQRQTQLPLLQIKMSPNDSFDTDDCDDICDKSVDSQQQQHHFETLCRDRRRRQRHKMHGECEECEEFCEGSLVYTEVGNENVNTRI